ncbi:MAG TPA: elongation factor 1-beta [Candidatus Caldiarchaeum subterraneum]|uniref:Elongation factor 1-beta n=1 Tax=Caldiarchaeum subterraneum TaxID=311458 RepID=A0A832ZUD1_CALS0|nr:elongation factor 1-beta [Aigarchaeota archaeon]HIQ28976.1 elongation factor 1-beta [Candidatus Caldarchaeum subterraneum]
MGNVLVILRILPNSPDVDLDQLMERVKKTLPEKIVVREYKKEDMAFGLKSILVGLTMPDEEGYTETLEDKIRNVEGVEDITIENITRIL